MEWAWVGIVLVLVVRLTVAFHRSVLVILAKRPQKPNISPPLSVWPPCSVQLPIFNEGVVALRVLRASSRLEYAGEWVVQVLDDSSDGTRQLLNREVARLSGRIQYISRSNRLGFKAGALANGMKRTQGEFMLVLDADYLPSPDLLQRLVPVVATRPDVAAVQARWTYLNRNENLLTRLQAIGLDSHFLVEQVGRNSAGLFLNFNGTCGLWRREAIENVGGWHGDTLTEDLDLSYRAQIAGWKIVFLPEILVPGELPVTLDAYIDQQSRWSQGCAQVCKKLLPSLWRQRLSWQRKLFGTLHLCEWLGEVSTVTSLIVLLPLVLLAGTPALSTQLIILSLFFLESVIHRSYYKHGQARQGRTLSWLDSALHLALRTGISVYTAAAALSGLLGKRGGWARTPKTGSHGSENSSLGDSSCKESAGGQRQNLGLQQIALTIVSSCCVGFCVFIGAWFLLPIYSGAAIGFLVCCLLYCRDNWRLSLWRRTSFRLWFLLSMKSAQWRESWKLRIHLLGLQKLSS